MLDRLSRLTSRALKLIAPARTGAVRAWSPIDVDEEVPRYPPYERGLPVFAPERVMGRQAEELIRIRQIFPFSDEQYEQLIAPVLHRYAAFVHLLPASEHNHHKGAGGLLRHGFEVAFLAGRAADAFVFLPEGTPQERKKIEIRWRVAIFFAALLHDIGKPISDLEVLSADGALVWRPRIQSIYDWANEHRLQRYFIRWRPGRGKDHMRLGVQVVSLILGREALDWLDQGGADINATMMAYLSGDAGLKHRLAEIVTAADSASVEQDLRLNGVGKIRDPGYGVPVEGLVWSAMRELIDNGTWSVNTPGARVWLIDDGFTVACYVVWKQAAEEIIDHLRSQGVKGVPAHHKTLAEVLIDRDLAEPRKIDGQVYPLWPVAPDVLSTEDGPIRLLMLRTKSPKDLFTEPPAAVPGKILNAERVRQPSAAAAVANARTASQQSQPAAAAATIATTPIPNAAGEAAAPAPEAIPRPPAVGPTDGPPPPSPSDYYIEPGGGERHASAEPAPGPELAGPTTIGPPPIQDFFSGASEPPPAPQPPPSIERSPPPPGLVELQAEPGRELAAAGAGGRLLATMASDIREGRRAWGEALCQVADRVLIRFPEGYQAYARFELDDGVEDRTPVMLSRLIADLDWIDLPDPTLPTKILTTIAGVKGVALRHDVAGLVLASAGDGRGPATTNGIQKDAVRSTAAPPAEITGTSASPEKRTPLPPIEPLASRPVAAPRAENRASPSKPPKELPAKLVEAIRELENWMRSEPCPPGVADHGSFRTASSTEIETRASRAGLRASDMRFGLHQGNASQIRIVGTELMLAIEEVRRA